MKKGQVLTGLVLMALLAAPLAAQDHGGGGGGGGGCGDVFGDLIHILRDLDTGQPVLQKRWIEYPMDIYDWGYCPIAVDAEGNEIGFLPLSCDPYDSDAVVEVDYFGRLNGGRTKERNNRMHFNEVISTIKAADLVKQEEAGRLMFGHGCTENPGGELLCKEWSVVDSPMENMGIYTRLMKYGHIQTDPLEVDTWAHGDPAAGTQYHPALGPEDWAKFHLSVRHLLPGAGQEPKLCFDNVYEDGFNPLCAASEWLTEHDFSRAGACLSGAANKTGFITRDLVQYFNRILKIPVATQHTVATPATLPALIRDCGAEAPPPPVGEEPPVEPEYPGPCVTYDAAPGMPAPADERFVDFGAAAYTRFDKHDERVELIMPVDEATWVFSSDVSLMDWLAYVNGPDKGGVFNIDAFVDEANDSLRCIELIHNYAIPDTLWDFGAVE